MQDYRQYFPITNKQVYLNHAAASPISTKVKEALDDYYSTRTYEKPGNWSETVRIASEFKTIFANMINAESPDRIAFTQNTTHGLNIIASGLQWEQGDQILLPEHEFPANVYPFKNLAKKGVEIKYLPTSEGGLKPETLQANISARTKLLSLSFV